MPLAKGASKPRPIVIPNLNRIAKSAVNGSHELVIADSLVRAVRPFLRLRAQAGQHTNFDEPARLEAGTALGELGRRVNGFGLNDRIAADNFL
jgi:hypothetical protein